MFLRNMLMMRLKFMRTCKKLNRNKEIRTEKIVKNKSKIVVRDDKKKKTQIEPNIRERNKIVNKEKMDKLPKKKLKNSVSTSAEALLNLKTKRKKKIPMKNKIPKRMIMRTKLKIKIKTKI